MAANLEERLEEYLRADIEARYGRKTPHPDRLRLRNGGTIYDGTVLYADIVGSTQLGERFGYPAAAKIIQSFLLGASHVARNHGGDITAYDGDRLMVVFGGEDQEVQAVKCAFSVRHLVRSTLNPIINRVFAKPAFAKHLRCCCGIDSGEMLAVKIGLRGNTDLLWSGRPANFAAKLCAHRSPAYATVITAKVFQALPEDLKREGERSFWKRFTCEAINMQVFGTDETWD